MAYEDFTTYTEVDPTSKITVDTNKVTTTAIVTRLTAAYVLKDKGADHFDGDFEHLVQFIVTAEVEARQQWAVWALSNVSGIAWQDPSLLVYFSDYPAGSQAIILREYDGAAYVDEYAHADNLNNLRYIKPKRDETVGTYGTAYSYIYSDLARTSLLDPLSLALHAKRDYQYVYGFSCRDGLSDYSETITGYIENLDLQESEAAVIQSVPRIARIMLAMHG